jgi:NNP family nitrate/nitrite transporter-like MFS transporter
MKLSDLNNTGHWPTLLAAFLYFDFSFMVWAVLGPLGAQIGETLQSAHSPLSIWPGSH